MAGENGPQKIIMLTGTATEQKSLIYLLQNKTNFMKKTVFYCFGIILSLNFFSCKDSHKVQSTDSQTGVETMLNEEEEEAIKEENQMKIYFAENEGKYTRMDLDIFSNQEFTNRIKKLVGEDYDEILENFNTETPVVSSEDVYKFTGCREHDCPSYFTTILYDAKNDNFNVLIDQNGKVKVFDEKGKITMTKSLRAK